MVCNIGCPVNPAAGDAVPVWSWAGAGSWRQMAAGTCEVRAAAVRLQLLVRAVWSRDARGGLWVAGLTPCLI